MNINIGQYNSLRYKNKPAKDFEGANNSSLNLNYNNINFGGARINRIFDKKTAQVTFENASELIDRINKSFGTTYFSDLLNKAGGFQFDEAKNTLIYKNRTLLGDLKHTVKAIPEIFVRLANATAKKLKIDSKFLKSWEENHAKEKAFGKALDIIDEFINPGTEFVKLRKTPELEIDVDKCGEIFKNTVSSNIAKVKKEYESRDERALNRIVTATVSAVYSANDFYNISMLQKDDKSEAKRAHSNRFSQEIERAALSAGLTFLSLGALDRYTKKNIFLNAIVIAGSTLISEIISRLHSGNPIWRITPAQAAKIAQKNAQKKTKEQNQAQQDSANNVSFKANLENEKEIYKNFIQKDGSLVAPKPVVSNVVEDTTKESVKCEETKPKKKSKIAKVFLGLFVASNVIYLMSKGFKGQFEFDKAKRAFMKKHGSELSYDNVAPELLEEMKKLKEVYDRRIEKHTILDKIKTAVTKKAVTIDKQDLISKLTELRATPEGQKIAGVIDTYISHVEKIKGDKIISDVDMVGVSGLYSGLTKIFETIYTFLSSPAALLHCAIRKFDKNSKWKFDNRDCEKFDKILAQNSPNYKKELTELGQIFDIQDEHVVFKQIRKVANIIKDKINHICTDVFHAKKGIFETEKTNAQIVELIKNRTRNVEIGAETGDLANISRTMVTIISTIFFVNDYRNRVLIESGGKDVKGANDEVKERLAHKASNFIINGTLMNTFNNVFKTPLNKSLFNAAVIAGCTETTNEFLVRKSICQPVGKKHSKDEIIQYELEQLNKGGFMGWWARTFKNITGKKSLTQKAGIDIKEVGAKQDK